MKLLDRDSEHYLTRVVAVGHFATHLPSYTDTRCISYITDICHEVRVFTTCSIALILFWLQIMFLYDTFRVQHTSKTVMFLNCLTVNYQMSYLWESTWYVTVHGRILIMYAVEMYAWSISAGVVAILADFFLAFLSLSM